MGNVFDVVAYLRASILLRKIKTSLTCLALKHGFQIILTDVCHRLKWNWSLNDDIFDDL